MKTFPQFSSEDYDLTLLVWVADRYGYARRAVRNEDGKRKWEYAHHIVCMRAFGRKADASRVVVCDHIDSDRLNNTRENLRLTTPRENTLNCVKIRSAHCITRHRKLGKWQVQFRRKYIGVYTDRSAAEAVVSSLKRKEIETRLETMPAREAMIIAFGRDGRAA